MIRRIARRVSIMFLAWVIIVAASVLVASNVYIIVQQRRADRVVPAEAKVFELIKESPFYTTPAQQLKLKKKLCAIKIPYATESIIAKEACRKLK